MSKQYPSVDPSSHVAHFVVTGEGARDNEWTDAPVVPLTFANLPHNHQFQLLNIPPSPTNAIVPIVRIFPAEAKPSFPTRLPSPSRLTPHPDVSPPLPASTSSPPSQSVHPKQPQTPPVNHSPAPTLSNTPAPRRLSMRGSRMIARPSATSVASTTPNPDPDPTTFKGRPTDTTALHRHLKPVQSVQHNPEASRTNLLQSAGKRHPSPSAPDQMHRTPHPSTTNVGNPQDPSKVQSKSTSHEAASRAAPISGNAKRSSDPQLKKSVSEQLANKAQADALTDMLKDHKKLYAPVKALPPLSSDPAAQALRAAQVQSPKVLGPSQRQELRAQTASGSSFNKRMMEAGQGRVGKSPETRSDSYGGEKSDANVKNPIEAPPRKTRIKQEGATVVTAIRDGKQAQSEIAARRAGWNTPSETSALKQNRSAGTALENPLAVNRAEERKPAITPKDPRPSKSSGKPRTNDDARDTSGKISINPLREGSGTTNARSTSPKIAKPSTFGEKKEGTFALNYLHRSNAVHVEGRGQLVENDATGGKASSSLRKSGEVGGAVTNHFLEEGFRECVKLLVRLLCTSGSTSGISKEAATTCRRELRRILRRPEIAKPTEGGKLPVSGPSAASRKEPKMQVQAPVGVVRSAQAHSIPHKTKTEVLDPLSNAEIIESSQKSSGQEMPFVSGLDKRNTEISQENDGKQVPSRNSATSLLASNSSAINGIRFTFIQWGLSVLKKDANVDEIAQGAKEIVNTCKSLKSSHPNSLQIQDDELLVHVLNLNAATSTIHFLLTSIDSLIQETLGSPNPRTNSITVVERALGALRDILVWVRYLTDRVVVLWNKYREGSIQGNHVRKFCDGMERFMKSSSAENGSDGFLSALRDCKKYFPNAKSLKRGAQDGKPFFDQRRALGEEVRSLLPMLGKVCSWCQKQLPGLRDPAHDSAETVKQGARIEENQSNDVGKRQPSEKVKDIVKATNPVKSGANNGEGSHCDISPRTSESQGQTIRRSSVHDPNVPVKRKNIVTSGARAGARTVIPRKSGPTDNPAAGQSDQSASKGRKQMKSGGRKSFDPNPMALMKSALSSASSLTRNDDLRSLATHAKATAVAPGSGELAAHSGKTRRSMSGVEDTRSDGTNGRPLKRRKGKGHVTFAPQLVVGQRESNVRREENASLFHDGYDLLGRENAIQESAVRERASQLSRGGMMALFGYLRHEFLKLKNESQALVAPVPAFLHLNYAPSSTKQISRRLDKMPQKHAQGQ